MNPPYGPNGMRPGLSLYLDFLRLAAALAVFVGHAHGYLLSSVPKIVASHADEAVAAFFVLSGFVIAFVADQKETRWQDYALARAVRLFSVVPIALLITYCADSIGNAINPDYYAGVRWYNNDYLTALFVNLTFTNELWFSSTTFGSNHAYWSLGFEAQYYLLFGLLLFLPKRLKAVGAASWALLVGPVISAYLALWWLGNMGYRLVKSNRGTAISGWLLFGASIGLYLSVKLGFSDVKIGIPNTGSLTQMLANWLYFMAVGAAVALNIIGASRILPPTLPLYAKLQPQIAWLAGRSFSLYLVHEPLLALGRAIIPQAQQSDWQGIVWVLGALALCFVVAEGGERRKNVYRAMIMSLPGHGRRKMG
jgi:peptidoglycan/LPS O-acetylase OafA/YrhL